MDEEMLLYQFDELGQYFRCDFYRTPKEKLIVSKSHRNSISLIHQSTKYTKSSMVSKRLVSTGKTNRSQFPKIDEKLEITLFNSGNCEHMSCLLLVPVAFLQQFYPEIVCCKSQRQHVDNLTLIRQKDKIFLGLMDGSANIPGGLIHKFTDFGVNSDDGHPTSLTMLFFEHDVSPPRRCFILRNFIYFLRSGEIEMRKSVEQSLKDKKKRDYLLRWHFLKHIGACLSHSPPSDKENHFHETCYSDSESHSATLKDCKNGIYIPPLNIAQIPRMRAASTSRSITENELRSRYETLISCVIPHKLFVGGEKPCGDPEYIKAVGITTIINLSPESSAYSPPAGIEYHEFDMWDKSSFDIKTYIKEIFDIIENPPRVLTSHRFLATSSGWEASPFAHFCTHYQQDEQSVVYLHCQKGISRSITMTIAYILWKFGTSVDRCLSMIKGDQSRISGTFPAFFLDGPRTNRNTLDSINQDTMRFFHEDTEYTVTFDRPIAQPNPGFTLQLYKLENHWKTLIHDSLEHNSMEK